MLLFGSVKETAWPPVESASQQAIAGKRVELVVGLVNVLFVIVDTQSRRLVFAVSRCELLCYWVTRTALWRLKPPPVK